MQSETLRILVRRAVAKARERDNSPRAAGVYVDLKLATQPDNRAQGAPLVTVECLREIPRGGTFVVPAGATITALAEEEAWRRNITLANSSAARATDAGGAWMVAVGADHGGFASKALVMSIIREAGHRPVDIGTFDETPVDYPDVAALVARGVAEGRFKVGVMIDGAGIGSAMAANKIAGVRAANCWNEQTAKNAREHNYANVLTLGGRMLDEATIDKIVRTFLKTPWGAERHGRRVDKITALEPRSSATIR